MMDEVWTRQWVGARDAARAVREQQRVEAMRKGQPVPSLWGDVVALVRDLITPPVRVQPDTDCCANSDCQSAA